MKYYKELGEKTFEQLNDADFHLNPSSESNSIAVMIQHIVGNMLSRFTNFLTEDGEKDWRNRDDEFEVHNYSKQQLIELWNKGWKCFFDAVESLNENELAKTITIRKEELTVTDAIIRQLAHYPYHIGQIVYVARLIKNENWKNLSIPKGHSQAYNQTSDIKDPAKKF
jgi:predicted secreted protein